MVLIWVLRSEVILVSRPRSQDLSLETRLYVLGRRSFCKVFIRRLVCATDPSNADMISWLSPACYFSTTVDSHAARNVANRHLVTLSTSQTPISHFINHSISHTTNISQSISLQFLFNRPPILQTFASAQTYIHRSKTSHHNWQKLINQQKLLAWRYSNMHYWETPKQFYLDAVYRATKMSSRKLDASTANSLSQNQHQWKLTKNHTHTHTPV